MSHSLYLGKILTDIYVLPTLLNAMLFSVYLGKQMKKERQSEN